MEESKKAGNQLDSTFNWFSAFIEFSLVHDKVKNLYR